MFGKKLSLVPAPADKCRTNNSETGLEMPARSVLSDDVLVLCYHAVSETWSADLSIAPKQLEAQITQLLRAGYEPVTFSNAVSRGSGRLLAVTFDDAFASTLELGKPILDRLGVPGTVFAVSNFAETGDPLRWDGINHWSDGPFGHELRSLQWAHLRAMANAGWEIGSHTCSHPNLTQCTDEELTRELVQSRAACERGLERPCTSIAYPYGRTDERVVAATARAGYACAAALPSRWHRAHPLCWPRVGVYNRDQPWRFMLKTSRAVRAVRLATRS
jgi:peptidoglycan/xylan/chitin deacetylase (PgdA/CDA1 family)